LYDWLRNREPRWATLAIIHRLDKETSGVIVFSKTPRANRSLTEQFAKRIVRKKYVLLTDREAHEKEFTIRSCVVRAGERYVSRPVHAGGDVAETRFRVVGDIYKETPENIQQPTSNLQRRSKIQDPSAAPMELESSLEPGAWSLELPTATMAVIAEPSRAAPINPSSRRGERVPILGDTLYGGTPAARVYLHAAEVCFKHPATGEERAFRANVDFGADPRLLIRRCLLNRASPMPCA